MATLEPPHVYCDDSRNSSMASSFEIENLLEYALALGYRLPAPRNPDEVQTLVDALTPLIQLGIYPVVWPVQVPAHSDPILPPPMEPTLDLQSLSGSSEPRGSRIQHWVSVQHDCTQSPSGHVSPSAAPSPGDSAVSWNARPPVTDINPRTPPEGQFDMDLHHVQDQHQILDPFSGYFLVDPFTYHGIDNQQLDATTFMPNFMDNTWYGDVYQAPPTFQADSLPQPSGPSWYSEQLPPACFVPEAVPRPPRATQKYGMSLPEYATSSSFTDVQFPDQLYPVPATAYFGNPEGGEASQAEGAWDMRQHYLPMQPQ